MAAASARAFAAVAGMGSRKPLVQSGLFGIEVSLLGKLREVNEQAKVAYLEPTDESNQVMRAFIGKFYCLKF